MINAVIIVLREVLEGVLLICMLMASARAMGHRLRWLPVALALGIAGAFSYGLFLEQISMSFDGLGQEITSATLLLSVSILLIVHNFQAIYFSRMPEQQSPSMSVLLVCIAIAAMSMTLEGAEIYLYVYGFGVQAGDVVSVMSGAAIGAGIGLSLGTFLYYGLRALPRKECLWASASIAMIAGAGQVMQATYHLEQADFLPAQIEIWDSSFLVSESSVTGELLQAAFGYEATPTVTQLTLYVGAIVASLAAMALARRRTRKHKENK